MVFGKPLVDPGQGLEAVFDDRGFDVVFGDQDGLQQDAGDFAGVGDAFRVRLFAFGQADGFLRGGYGLVGDGFVDGHRLRALGDGDDGREIGVLSGDEDFAGELVFGEGLDRASGHAVVGRDDGGDVRAWEESMVLSVKR